ncbi:MAG: response regulator [Proteobacteria bacterium]|nr:response regulator [Pseudomonadota bacterium]
MTPAQKILIVDDRKENLVALKQVLRSIHVEIIEATNGNDALAATLDHTFALAILDVMMPEMNGFELAEHLRKDKSTGLLPVIFVTAAYQDEQQIFNGYEAGGVDYIIKPYAPEVLLAKVRVFLEIDRQRQEIQWQSDHLEALVEERTQALALELAERKRADEALIQNEARLRIALDNAPFPIMIHAEDGHVEMINSTWSELTGYTLSDIPTTAEWTEKAYGERRTIVQKDIDDLYDLKGKKDEGEYQVRTKSGMVLVWDFSSASLGQFPDGRRAVISMAKDITQRKKAEEALIESEERLRMTLEATKTATWDWEIKNDQWHASPHYHTLLGYNPDPDFSDREVWLERVHPDDRGLVKEKIERILSGKDSEYIYEARLRHADGTYRWQHVSGYVVQHDTDGKPLHMMGTRVDITGRKQAEAEQETLQAQLNQAQKMEYVGRLAGGVAHDFNNMLGVILGNTELALEQVDLGSSLHSDLMEIQKAAMRSADFTRQLLAFARKQTVAPKILDLNDTVEGMLKMLRRLIGEDIDLAWLPGTGLWPVKMDPGQIDQILANFCVNARDAITDVGTVTIETSTETFDKDYCSNLSEVVPGDYVLLNVSDNGLGMTQETLGHLFEPFFTTKEMGKGTGLGLATVYGIVKQNNGFIRVESEPGQGTSFRIYLPRYEGKDDAASISPPTAESLQGQETILLVEDEPAILKMTSIMLENQGYTLLAASSPKEAVTLAQKHTGEIHLLMTDVIMPEMNGRELSLSILSLYPNLKCLFMSGYTADVIAHHGVLDEHVNFIQKPFAKMDLALKIRRVLED